MDIVSKLPLVKSMRRGGSSSYDGDFADKLSYVYSTVILIFFTMMVSTKQYVGSPISCHIPSHFSGAQVDYTLDYCWIRNTYHLPLGEVISDDIDKSVVMIAYYQWMHIILLAQAILFHLPINAWQALKNHYSIDDFNVDRMNMDEKIEMLINHIRRRCRKNRIVLSYYFLKFLFLANIIIQYTFLSLFFGRSFVTYGFSTPEIIKSPSDIGIAPFPRVTLCDLSLKKMGNNVQRYTIQCVLPINLFNEKIYLFFWYWLAFVTLVTVISIVTWTARLFIPRFNKSYREKRNLLVPETMLGKDGLFLIRFAEINSNSIMAKKFVDRINYKFQSMEDFLSNIECDENEDQEIKDRLKRMVAFNI